MKNVTKNKTKTKQKTKTKTNKNKHDSSAQHFHEDYKLTVVAVECFVCRNQVGIRVDRGIFEQNLS